MKLRCVEAEIVRQVMHKARTGDWPEDTILLDAHSLYVYCNVCEPQIVGDAYVPLLRNVAIKGAHGEYVTKTYSEPHYIPVNTDAVDMIEINIKDDTGYDVSFASGKVVCKLHFRNRAL